MSMDDGPDDEFALGLSEAADQQATLLQRLQHTTREMVGQARTVSVLSNEGLRAVLGGCVGMVLGIGIAVTAPILAPAVPFISVMGLAAGVWLGRDRHIGAAQRKVQIEEVQSTHHLHLADEIQSRINGARSLGAPDEVVKNTWYEWQRSIKAAGDQHALRPAQHPPPPPLLTPPCPHLPPHY